jgi:uncharacterized protein (DUF849 family)
VAPCPESRCSDFSAEAHGEAIQWEVISAAGAAGIDVRVGLEDVLVLPDGSAAADNAELVRAAVRLITAPS